MLFSNDDVSASTVLTGLKGASRGSELYPKDFEHNCCQKTRDRQEYDTFSPDQIISVPSERNADGSIDIIMSSRVGDVFRRTEADDRVAWDATSHSAPSGRHFPWEQLPRDASTSTVLEFVAEHAHKNKLGLVDITIFPKAVDHGSFTVRTSVCNTWSSLVDKVKKEANQPLSKRCLSIMQRLVSEYLNQSERERLPATPPTKRARCGEPTAVPKSVFVEESISSSSDGIQSSHGSMTEVSEFSKNRFKNGKVMVNLHATLDQAFDKVEIRCSTRKVLVANGKQIKVWRASGTCVFRGRRIDLPSAETRTQPSSTVKLPDQSTWYYKKSSALAALIWYNLIEGTDAQWRKRWCRHLLGDDSSVLLWRTMFDVEDAVVCLSEIVSAKSNKKKYVLRYPTESDLKLM